MAISFRGYALTAPLYTASLVLDVPSGVVAGDVLLAHIVARLPNSQTVTPPAGWTIVDGEGGSPNGGIAQWVFYHVAGSSEPASYTFTWSAQPSGTNGGAISAWIGVDNTNPIDAGAASGQANSTNVTAPSISPAGSSDMLACFYAQENGTASQTVPADLTAGYNSLSGGYSASFFFGYKQLSASGPTGTEVATLSASDYNTGTSVALAPASGASTQTITPSTLSDESILSPGASGKASATAAALLDEILASPDASGNALAAPAALPDETIAAPGASAHVSLSAASLAVESIASPAASALARAVLAMLADETLAAPGVGALARAAVGALLDEAIAVAYIGSGTIAIAMAPALDEAAAEPLADARARARFAAVLGEILGAPSTYTFTRLAVPGLSDEFIEVINLRFAGATVVGIVLKAAVPLEIALDAAPALNIAVGAEV